MAYAVSPIDLIPDFIPVLGQLDDLLLIPLGLFLAWKMVPRAVMADCRALARRRARESAALPASRRWLSILLVGLGWAGLLALLGLLVLRSLLRR